MLSIRRFLTGTLLVLASAVAAADESALTLAQAVDRALANNPAIRASEAAVNIQRARRDSAALGTQYLLTANIEDAFGSGQFENLDSAEATLRLSRTVELGKKRQYREELGTAQVVQAELDVIQQRVDVAGEVARRYAEALRAQQRLVLAGETLAINTRTVDIVQRRYDVGRASAADLALANVALARTELATQRLELELEAAKVRLSVLWGAEQPDFAAVAGSVFEMPVLMPFETLTDRLSNNVTLRRIESEVAVNQANQRLAESVGSPNLVVSGGVRRFEQTGDNAVVFSVGVPLGSGTRAATRRREAESRSTQIPLLRRNQQLEVRTQLYVTYASLEADRQQFEGLRSRVLPEAQNAVTFYQRGYETGSAGLLDLLAAQRQLLELRIETLNAATDVHLNLIDIETLLGNENPGEALL